MNKLQLPIVIIYVSILSACSGIQITDKDGTVHHLIIGIGVVSSANTNDDSSVQVIKSNVIGLHLSSQPGLKFGAGYLSSSTLKIPSNANVTVEVKEKPMGTIVIESIEYKEEEK